LLAQWIAASAGMTDIGAAAHGEDPARRSDGRPIESGTVAALCWRVMVQIDEVSEICDVGFDDGVAACGQLASSIFHIGRDRQVTVARCAFHAKNFRRALKATLRGVSWMEQRMPVRVGVAEGLTTIAVLPC